MTENKRFIIPEYPDCIIDTVEDKEYTMSSYYPHMSCICDLLNNLSEENEQLKEDKNELFIRERDAKNNCRKLKYENEQLKKKIKSLEDANEGLTETIAHLDVEGFMDD